MYTSSYSIEKVAASNRREAIAAAQARRTARELRRTSPAGARPESPSAGAVRIPRPGRWFGIAVAGR